MRIRVLRLDDADYVMGIRYGQEFEAELCQTTGGAIYFLVNLPEGTYYLRNDQVEKA